MSATELRDILLFVLLVVLTLGLTIVAALFVLHVWVDFLMDSIWFDNLRGRLFRRVIHRDDFGVLYRVPTRRLRPHFKMVVKVCDSTGVYWISVPPHMRRAKQAVAWTYNKSEDDYNPTRA